MKPGQVTARWWQRLLGGFYASHHDLVRDAFAEKASQGETELRFLKIPDDPKVFKAPERLAAPAFFHTSSFLLQQDRADWQYCDPRLMRWAAIFIELARNRKIPLYVHSAFRTQEEQAELLRRRVTKAAWPNSAHNMGEAVDIVHGVHHWNMTRQEWNYLRVLGNEALSRVNAQLPMGSKLLLTWGGDFKSIWDPAHWEITDFRMRKRRLATGQPVRRTPRNILKHIHL